MLHMSITLIVVMVSWVFHMSRLLRLHIQYVPVFVYQLYFNKSVKKIPILLTEAEILD